VPDRTTAPLIVLLALAGFPGCDSHAEAARAYAEARFEDASRVLARHVDAAGEDAPAELRWNRALAALRAGDLAAAETAVRAVGAGADPELAALSDFLAGNVAFARAELAEAQARTPEAEPFAFDVAITHAEAARRSWILAATSRDDWPAARRNVERALAKLDDLRRQKDEKSRNQQKGREPGAKGAPRPAAGPGEAPPRPLPEAPQGTGDPAGEAPDAAGPAAELSREDVLRLFEKLAEKDRQKADVRRAAQQAQRTGAGKDW
jgi:hypothetical protein